MHVYNVNSWLKKFVFSFAAVLDITWLASYHDFSCTVLDKYDLSICIFLCIETNSRLNFKKEILWTRGYMPYTVGILNNFVSNQWTKFVGTGVWMLRRVYEKGKQIWRMHISVSVVVFVVIVVVMLCLSSFSTQS